jgi:hypothetical protein
MLFTRLGHAFQSVIENTNPSGTMAANNTTPSQNSKYNTPTSNESVIPKINDSKQLVRAIENYEGNDSSELSFNQNDIISVLQITKDGEWSKGELRGKLGLFPTKLAVPLPGSEREAPQSTTTTTTTTTISTTTSPSTPNNPAVESRKAVYDFDTQESGEINFVEGDIIQIIEKYEDTDWWKGMNTRTKDIGLFPSNYTTTVEGSLPSSLQTSTKNLAVLPPLSIPIEKDIPVVMVKALFDYVAQEEGEISFQESQIFKLIEKYDDSDWWKGLLIKS